MLNPYPALCVPRNMRRVIAMEEDHDFDDLANEMILEVDLKTVFWGPQDSRAIFRVLFRAFSKFS